MEPFTSTNIAELYQSHGISVSNFHKCRDKFIESGKKEFYELGRSGYDEYKKENEKLKRLVGNQASVINEVKKLEREEIMEAVNTQK